MRESLEKMKLFLFNFFVTIHYINNCLAASYFVFLLIDLWKVRFLGFPDTTTVLPTVVYKPVYSP